jgi:hypothetical protein
MLTWKWKVATQQGFDWLTCEVDGVEVAGISTKTAAWLDQAIRVPAGATVRWIYRKDATGTVGEDAGYLSGLTFEKFDGAPAGYDQWAEVQGSEVRTTLRLRMVGRLGSVDGTEHQSLPGCA